MNRIQRISKLACFLLLSALGLIMVGYWLLPVPKSPDLTDSSGVVLDDETQAKLTQVVFDAARTDDVETIQEFLREGFTPNVRSRRGDTLLTVAAYRGSKTVVRLLLTRPRINIEARNRMGLTAVSAAAFQGHDRCLRELLAAGADPDGANSLGQTALMFASLAGRNSSIEILRLAGADIHASDAMGNDAIQLARSQSPPQIANRLLSSHLHYNGQQGRSDAPMPLELK